MNTPAMIIDFEATDVSKEAEATQLGCRNVSFNNEGALTHVTYHNVDGTESIKSLSVDCKPDRTISYGAMAVSHITPSMLEDAPNHKDIVPLCLPKGEAYIIGHNVDYDIQVAANAGVDVSQYKAICTQALARRMLPNLDSHSLGALTYAINPDRAKQYCRNAHDAGYDVTFTLWLLEEICEIGFFTSMEQLYLASEEARIPLVYTFGKHKGKNIKEMACHEGDRKYLSWTIDNVQDKPYLITACNAALSTIALLVWTKEVPTSALPLIATISNGDSYHVYYSTTAPKLYGAIKKVGGQLVDDAYFDTLLDAKAWCVKHFNIGAFYYG